MKLTASHLRQMISEELELLKLRKAIREAVVNEIEAFTGKGAGERDPSQYVSKNKEAMRVEDLLSDLSPEDRKKILDKFSKM